MPPGAPHWRLPPPEQKMVFINLSPAELCAAIKDPEKNNGRDLPAMLKHVAEDKLVLWGWDPGVGRAPVDVPHAQEVLVEAFDAVGRRVALLHEGTLAAGRHPLVLDGAGLPAGVYVVRAAASAGVVTRTVVVAR